TTPGAPIDNSLAERALKLFIRQRKNSLFYKSPHSAYIASVLTSLIATCIYGGVNAVEYLVALQEHQHEVFVHPAAWLPWAYAASRASPLGHPSPVLGHLGALGVAVPGQNDELASGQEHACVGTIGPPRKMSLGESLHHDPVALAVIE